MMDAATIISTSLQVADLVKETYVNYPCIKKWFNRKFRKPIHVLIVGESGSGKTQFLSTIQGEDNFPEKRTMFSHDSTLELPNGRRVIFCDTPGHQSMKPERDRSINDINRKKYNGIVNIVCYGYQSTEGLKESDVFQGDSIKESFLKENRERELKQIQEWLPRIDKNCQVDWVLTIINKADIWWEQKEQVVDYYAEGSSYEHELQQISRLTKAAIIPYCSLISPFMGRPRPSIFGDKIKYALHVNLCKQLGELIGIEWLK
jgi:GTPase Era involved in 16S rRNA processing